MSKPYMKMTETCDVSEQEEFRRLNNPKANIFRRLAVWLLKKLPKHWLMSSLSETHDFYVIALFKNGRVTKDEDGMENYEADGCLSWQCTPTQCYTILYELSKKMDVAVFLQKLQKEDKDARVD
jgi:hypothetical protein